MLYFISSCLLEELDIRMRPYTHPEKRARSLRFKNFDSSRNSLNPTLRPNLRPNSDDSLRHVIDSCKIFDPTYGVRSKENKTDLGWF